MDSFILQQLNKVKLAKLPSFDINTTELFIPKLTTISIHENNYYLIELDDNLLKDHDSALTVNWNNGSVPKYKFYKVDVSKIMGQMIKVNGLAFDPNQNQDINELWSGWLPLNSIKIIEKI